MIFALWNSREEEVVIVKDMYWFRDSSVHDLADLTDIGYELLGFFAKGGQVVFADAFEEAHKQGYHGDCVLSEMIIKVKEALENE